MNMKKKLACHFTVNGKLGPDETLEALGLFFFFFARVGQSFVEVELCYVLLMNGKQQDVCAS